MKLWNQHVFNFPITGSKLFPSVCQLFVRRYANLIVEKNLRYCALLSFIHKYKSSLLSFNDITNLMEVIDNEKTKQINRAT